jgi:hypothetical protein
MTRISVAHRPEIGSGADRILRVAKTLARSSHGSAPNAIADQRKAVVPSHA